MRWYDTLATPIGPLLLVGDGDGLVELGLPEHGRAPRPPDGAKASRAHLRPVARQLDEYFAGQRT